jgi:ABC-type polysaccharide/polyol phosphate transport system ATPase subunit
MIDLSAGFHRDLTGRENLLTAGVLSCLTRKEIKERYDAITSFSGLDPDEINSPLFTYSSGMMLRLGFALAINSSPSVLLLDEVMAVGDVNFRRKCVERISSELDSGCAGVLVSHDLKLVAERCERVVVLDNGRQMFTGPAGAALDFYLNLMGEGDPTADRLVAGE